MISPILYEGSTLISFDFLMKENFWSVVFILDITSLSVCNTSIRVQDFSWIKKIP